MRKRVTSNYSIVRAATIAGLLSSASVAVMITSPALAQTAQASFNIPAGSLSSALAAFGRQSGLQVTYAADIATGKSSPGVSGSLAPREAVARLLQGTGLGYNVSGRTVVISDPGYTASGAASDAVQLEQIDVSGSGGTAPEDAPYQTPGAVSYISGEQIERYRGTSPSDLLKGAPGVYSGESRASGGLDVNIRGLQGQGRVPVTVDGAQNSTALYRGYQGISNSTFVDPDFIGGITIEKGPSTGASGAGAIGGLVSMRTLNADDIIPDGESFGSRIKLQAGTNTEAPFSSVGKASLLSELSLAPPQEYNWKYPTTDVSRPGIFDINSGSASIVMATRSENVDLVGGFSRRRSGNYHAGENGGDAPKPVDCGTPQTPCGFDWYRTGLTSYLAGEEVLNTSQDIYSGLLKATLRFADDHTLDLGYSHYHSEHGEQYPFGFWNNIQQAYQTMPSVIDVDSYTSRYRWDPQSDLIDLRVNAFSTLMDEHSAASGQKVNKEAQMRGGDISNTSLFDTAWGALSFNYGASYLYEETNPVGPIVGIPSRNGERNQASVFNNTNWQPVDWLELDAGLRYQRYEAKDNAPTNPYPDREDDAFDYSAGVTLIPVDGLQVYGTYKDASRLPSLFESAGGFATIIAPDVRPENAKTWEVGVNVLRDDVFTEDDSVKLKLGYFDSEIDDYINRSRRRVCTYPSVPGGPCDFSWQFVDQMYISNIDQANFAGFDLTARYEWGGFSADLMASYFTNVEFCRTAGDCRNSSLAADYATNHIPPEYRVSLTLTQKLLDDKLMLSGRVSHTGPRSADAEPTGAGAQPFIAPIDWEPFTLVDLWASYKVSKAATLSVSVENLMDIYYVDPLSLALMPSPGRTIRFGLTGEFSESTLAALAGKESNTDGSPSYDWSGPYIGVNVGGGSSMLNAEEFIVNGIGSQQFKLDNEDMYSAGVQAGYNVQLANNFVLGIEGDLSYVRGSLTSASPTDTIREKILTDFNWNGSIRGRVGYAIDKFLVYGTAGYAVADISGGFANRVRIPGSVPVAYTWAETWGEGTRYTGWTAGGGLEYALSDNISLKADYKFSNLTDGHMDPITHNGVNYSWTAKPKLDEVKFGVNYRF